MNLISKRMIGAVALLALGWASAAKADVAIVANGNYTGGWANAMVAFNPGDLIGTLTGATIDVDFSGQVGTTWASDLGVAGGLGASMPLAPGLFQMGGFSNGVGGVQFNQGWGGNGNSTADAHLTHTTNLVTPVGFAGTGADPTVFWGNFFNSTASNANWTGTITLHGVDVVPEPASLMLVGLGLVGLAAVRRRK